MAKKNRRKGNGGIYDVSHIVEKANQDIPQNTRQLEEYDGFADIIEPPYSPDELLRIVEESDILKPLINGLASNTALFGYGIRFQKNFDYDDAPAEVKNEADSECEKLTMLYKYFNASQTFNRLLYKVSHDKESIGYGMIEVIRNGAGEVCAGEYARACNFRIVPQKAYDRITIVKKLRVFPDGSFDKVEMPCAFKKFVQVINNEKVFFKEFGDPRAMDYTTGEYKEDTQNQATEIIFFSNHCSYSDYGVPKWAGNIPNLIGNRKSEELNLIFFMQGKMMPFAIMVSGGQLTDDSLEALKSGKGIDNAFKALLLEALPDESSVNMPKAKDDAPKVNISIEHLTDTSLTDGLFMEYQKANREKVRAAFRLPPIYLGDSSDYNRATADVAKLIAEEQVFVPEREEIADAFNSVINSELEIQYCEMYLKGPKIGSVAEIAGALQPFITAGTVTPNMLIEALGELLDKEINAVLPDEIGNVPIEILKLQMQAEQGRVGSETDIQKTAAVDTFDKMLEVMRAYIHG